MENYRYYNDRSSLLDDGIKRLSSRFYFKVLPTPRFFVVNFRFPLIKLISSRKTLLKISKIEIYISSFPWWKFDSLWSCQKQILILFNLNYLHGKISNHLRYIFFRWKIKSFFVFFPIYRNRKCFYFKTFLKNNIVKCKFLWRSFHHNFTYPGAISLVSYC